MGNANIIGRRENAVLNSRTFIKFQGEKYTEVMTVQGTVNKTAILLIVVAASATLGWLSISHNSGMGQFALWLGPVSVGALFIALITSAKMKVAPFTAPLYAFLEGLVLGGISALFEAKYPGVAIQAVFLTFATLFGLLVLYSVTGFHVTSKFRAGVIVATLAIALVYTAIIVLRIFGMDGLPFIHQTGLIGIGSSLFVICIASLNLIPDFDLIETGAREGAPLFMEWYAAFGLMVTLIWLYLEILELLVRIAASSDDR